MGANNLKTVDIKGKAYVEVNERIRYFRERFPKGRILTEIVSIENGVCIFKAEVYNENDLVAVGHAYEKEGSTFINKTSYIENCETSAIGRALGVLGIGIDASVASALEVANAIENQNIQTQYKTQSKSTDEEKKKYWSEFSAECKKLDIDAKEFLTEWCEATEPKAIQNIVSKYLKDKDTFAEQLINYRENKMANAQ